MAPKIQGIIRFLESGGRRAIVTCPSDLEDAIAGNAGTEFVQRA
jgi:carbamate kinase